MADIESYRKRLESLAKAIPIVDQQLMLWNRGVITKDEALTVIATTLALDNVQLRLTLNVLCFRQPEKEKLEREDNPGPLWWPLFSEAINKLGISFNLVCDGLLR